jgi:hypothetical protein
MKHFFTIRIPYWHTNHANTLWLLLSSSSASFFFLLLRSYHRIYLFHFRTNNTRCCHLSYLVDEPILSFKEICRCYPSNKIIFRFNISHQHILIIFNVYVWHEIVVFFLRIILKNWSENIDKICWENFF